MEAFVVAYAGLSGYFFLRMMGAVLPRKLGLDKSPRDVAYDLGDEEVRRKGWAARLKAEVVVWTSMACNAIAWPLERVVALFIPAEIGAQLRLHSIMRLYAVDLVLQPLVVLLILGAMLAAGTAAPFKLVPGVLLVAYGTLGQVQLLASADEAGAQLRRSLWNPVAKAGLLATTHVLLLLIGYAALAHAEPLAPAHLREAADALSNQHRLLARLADWRQHTVWELAAGASGLLFMAALGRTTIAFWKLTRNDDDWNDIAKSQLFASRFDDARRSLSQIRNESQASQFHRQIAALGVGDIDEAVRQAQFFWSTTLGRSVSPTDAGALLLRLGLYPMPWPHAQQLLERSVAAPLANALVYSVVLRFSARSDVVPAELEALLRRHAGADDDHQVLLALFLFAVDRHDEAAQAVRACTPAGPVARAVAAAILIRDAIARESGRENQARAFAAQDLVSRFAKACDESTDDAHDLRFLIKWSGTLASMAKELDAPNRLAVAAIHSRLEERLRLAAPADDFDREMYPIGDPRRLGGRA